MPIITQRSTDKLPYTFDFSTWSVFDDSVITSATITGSPSGLTIGTVSINAAGDEVTATITGGTSGTTYRITCSVSTALAYSRKEFFDLYISDPSASP